MASPTPACLHDVVPPFELSQRSALLLPPIGEAGESKRPHAQRLILVTLLRYRTITSISGSAIELVSGSNDEGGDDGRFDTSHPAG